MGGAVGGARASAIVVNTLRDAVYADPTADAPTALRNAILVANGSVYRDAAQDLELKGMGATCVALLIRAGHATFANVGDSRLYLVRDEHILQLTNDHTKIRLLLDAGMITPEEAINHPDRSVLVRSIGPKPEVEVDAESVGPIQTGDRFVLCSDGLTNHVGDAEILVHVENRDEQQAAESLVNLALERGGSDNITVIVVGVGGYPKPPAAIPATVPPVEAEISAGEKGLKRRDILLITAIVLALLALAAVGVLGWHIWQDNAAPDVSTDQTIATAPPTTAPAVPPTVVVPPIVEPSTLTTEPAVVDPAPVSNEKPVETTPVAAPKTPAAGGGPSKTPPPTPSGGSFKFEVVLAPSTGCDAAQGDRHFEYTKQGNKNKATGALYEGRGPTTLPKGIYDYIFYWGDEKKSPKKLPINSNGTISCDCGSEKCTFKASQ